MAEASAGSGTAASGAPRVVRSAEPATEAAQRLARAIGEVMRAREDARLAIPGGSALAALAPARAELGARWRRVRLTWVDERCVPRDHPDSNRGQAYRSGALDPSDPPADELVLFEDGERGADAAVRVAAGLRARFDGALDVLLLGLGEDGHIASLFPGAWQQLQGLVAFVSDSPKPPPERLTLTRALLGTASHAVLLAAGEGKRAALERLLAGARDQPACGLRGLEVVTDLELARGDDT